jgi:GTPase involved in cell partitioning and DNA repair
METVVSCQKIKEKDGKSIYAIGLSDGRGGESFAVEIPVGTSVSDLNIEETQWGTRIKFKKAMNGYSGGGGGKSRGGNESFALAYSKDLVVAGKVDLKQILATADKLYAWLESKKPISAPAPQPQQQPRPTAPTAPAYTPPPGPGVTDDLPF